MEELADNPQFNVISVFLQETFGASFNITFICRMVFGPDVHLYLTRCRRYQLNLRKAPLFFICA
jgi:hypothetical protein